MPGRCKGDARQLYGRGANATFSFALRIRHALLILVIAHAAKVHADTTLLIEGPINFLGHVSSTGHAALLVDSLCSDDHIQIRLCRADEDGTVISRYEGIAGYDWVAMPPGPYLFAVESPDEIPAWANANEVSRLRNDYRSTHDRSFMRAISQDSWIQLLGASYRRQIVCIHVHTTAAQEYRLMQWLNSRPDRTHFNFFFRNCADFARQMLNVLYPGAIHRNLPFDFGMTTPKQLESSLHHYARRHPELDFHIYKLPQAPGAIARSGHLYGVTESLVKSKPYLFALSVFNPIGFGSLAALGIADRRYTGKDLAAVDDGFFFHSQTTIAVGPLTQARGNWALSRGLSKAVLINNEVGTDCAACSYKRIN